MVVDVRAMVAMVMPMGRKRRRGKHRHQKGSEKDFLHGFDSSIGGRAAPC